MRSSVLAVAAAGLWAAWEGALLAVDAPGRDRRLTGSHERRSHDPVALPTTSWFDDAVPDIEPGGWPVEVAGIRLGLSEVESLDQDTFSAVLDCTSGWHSEQEWTGVGLDRLIEPGDARSFVVSSPTGYSRRFPVRDLERTWLVTRLGGDPLTPGRGFPARIVAPSRRGFWWVKWVNGIEVSPIPWWLQSPFPLT